MGLGVIVEELLLGFLVALGEFEEYFDGAWFEDFLMSLEVVETHFNPSGDFAELGFLLVECQGVVMELFVVCFHGFGHLVGWDLSRLIEYDLIKSRRSLQIQNKYLCI